MKLLVVGTVAFDDIETPHGRREAILGGSTTYFSYAASFFTDVGLVGAVGDDFPAKFVDVLTRQGIETSGLEKIAGKKTFHWSGRYEGAMNEAQTLDTRLNVLADYVPSIPEDQRETPFVFLANAEPRLQLSVLDQVKGQSFLVCDTMNLWIETALDPLKEVFRRVDGVVINEGEARMLTNRDNIVAAADAVREMGPRTVVVKRGEYGAFLSCRDGRFALPAYPVKTVVDPTGAGDSFAGGMMGYLASVGRSGFSDLKRAMAYGTIAASFNVEDFSLERFQQITRDDIEKRLEDFLEFISL
jgi:sugar/nucleoside kinase (ribokinase family)